MTSERSIHTILSQTHPYDALSPDALADLAGLASERSMPAGKTVQTIGKQQEALFLIVDGQVEVTDEGGQVVSILGPGNSFGERGLMRDGLAARTVRTVAETGLVVIPADVFAGLVADHPAVRRFFERGKRPVARRDITSIAVNEVMTRDPLTCSADATIREAAGAMRDANVSCILVTEAGDLTGILTTRDLTNKVLAASLPYDTAIAAVMTHDPIALPPDALISDVLHLMVERGISHMPVVDDRRLVGILTQSDLTRVQAASSAAMIYEIARAPDADKLADITKGIPDLLVQLVGSNNPHQVVTRLITDITDAVTRRLLALAEEKLGPAPVPYLWLACGSQGRQEQTGVSDQDNCLILSDDFQPEHDAYFEAMAKIVTDGLDRAGYVYCPGDMMASNPRWRQPRGVWKKYFRGWIDKPDPMAQMLASVMFDLRPIGGDQSLWHGLQADTLAAASKNSIFVAHMVSNSLKHHPPLGLLRGLVTIRDGEHKNAIDLKHNGVVPVVDLGRIYSLRGQITAANTRARLNEAVEIGQLSGSGGQDLIDAYDMIAEKRLEHQARQIKQGEKPDNFMIPASLSDFERSHLRDAFVVIKTMQTAAGSRGGPLS